MAIVSVANQVGPKLVSYAIDDGMIHPDMAVVALAAFLFLAPLASLRSPSGPWSRSPAGWPRVMNDLRVSVFTHLQRLGLDFYTDEKAGVIMSRMTSDIENLQQLLQDGLAQFAVQGLTMVVIAAILFATNALLAAITVLLIVAAAHHRLAVVSVGVRTRL